MKKFLLLMIFMNSSIVMSQEVPPAEVCIAENSGAGSIECLEKLYKTLNQELDQLDQDVLESLEIRDKNDIITSVHYESAVTAFKKSVEDFKHYRESSCNFRTYYSGAVASGYGQVLYKCLIEQTEMQNQFLKHILKP